MAPDSVVVWIPFLAIPLGIGMIITLMVLMHRAKIRELDQRHRERMAAIEKGLDPSYGAGTDAADGPRSAQPWTSDCPPPAICYVAWSGSVSGLRSCSAPAVPRAHGRRSPVGSRPPWVARTLCIT